MVAAATSSSSSSDDGVNATTVKRVSARASDTCQCESVDDSSALAQRSCYDCLNVALQSGGSCAINPFGKCMIAATRFAQKVADSYAFEAPGTGNFYLASNFTYCERSEATCASCRTGWESAYPDGYFGSQSDRARQAASNNSSSSSSSLVCYGANGCLCLAYCELPRYRASIPDTCGSSATGYSPPPLLRQPSVSIPSVQVTSDFENKSSSVVAWIQFFFVLTALLVVLIPMVIACRRQIRTKQMPLDIFYARSYQAQDEQPPQQIHQQQQRRTGQPRGPPLTLAGWIDHREKLTSSVRQTGQPRDALHESAQIASEEEPPLLSPPHSSTPRPSDEIEVIALSRNEELT